MLEDGFLPLGVALSQYVEGLPDGTDNDVGYLVSGWQAVPANPADDYKIPGAEPVYPNSGPVQRGGVARELLDRSQIAFDNETLEDDLTYWARVVFRHQDVTRDTIGTDRRLTAHGSVFVQVFAETGERSAIPDTLALAIGEHICGDSYKLGGLYFQPPRIVEIPPDGKWYGVAVEIPVTYYDDDGDR